MRKQHEVFAGGELEIIQTENEHVLGFTRIHAGKRAIILANFSEEPQPISSRIIEQYGMQNKERLYGRSNILQNLDPLDLLIFG